MEKVTIRDVAKKAGVGVGTVSRVINGSASVSQQTRQKVLTVIDELNFQPNQTARRLSLGKTLTIGVVVPFFTHPSYVERLRGIDSVLSKSEYDLILFNIENVGSRDTEFKDVLRYEHVDGLLIITLTPNDRQMKRFRSHATPIVLIDAYRSDVSHVRIDDVYGGYQATKHLIDLGHRKVACMSDFLEDDFDSRSTRDRFVGYYSALEEAGIPFQTAYHRQGPHSRAEARRLAHQLFNLPDPPTAIFAYSDTHAFGVLEAAQEAGIKVPDELSVIGYDDIEIAEYLNLTTIRQSLFDSGLFGAQLLLDELNNRAPTDVQEIVIPTELVVRGTTTTLKNS